jgi:hypothetical protein
MSHSIKRRIAKLEAQTRSSRQTREELQAECDKAYSYIDRFTPFSPKFSDWEVDPSITLEEIVEFELWSERLGDPDGPQLIIPTTPEDHAAYAPLVKERLKTRGKGLCLQFGAR